MQVTPIWIIELWVRGTNINSTTFLLPKLFLVYLKNQNKMRFTKDHNNDLIKQVVNIQNQVQNHLYASYKLISLFFKYSSLSYLPILSPPLSKLSYSIFPRLPQPLKNISLYSKLHTHHRSQRQTINQSQVFVPSQKEQPNPVSGDWRV